MKMQYTSPLQKMLFQNKCFELGIVPFEYTKNATRKEKRKFRKLWRKLNKSKTVGFRFGLAVGKPTKGDMCSRRSAVMNKIFKELNAKAHG